MDEGHWGRDGRGRATRTARTGSPGEGRQKIGPRPPSVNSLAGRQQRRSCPRRTASSIDRAELPAPSVSVTNDVAIALPRLAGGGTADYTLPHSRPPVETVLPGSATLEPQTTCSGLRCRRRPDASGRPTLRPAGIANLDASSDGPTPATPTDRRRTPSHEGTWYPKQVASEATEYLKATGIRREQFNTRSRPGHQPPETTRPERHTRHLTTSGRDGAHQQVGESPDDYHLTTSRRDPDPS